jgi:hypothetical protein
MLDVLLRFGALMLRVGNFTIRTRKQMDISVNGAPEAMRTEASDGP